MRTSILGLALLLAACSDSEPKKTTSPQLIAPEAASVASLVPKDASYVARIESTQRLNAMLGRLAEDVGLPFPTQPLPMLAAMFGIEPSIIHEDKALYIALGRENTAAGMPAATLIAPTDDPQKIADGMQQRKTGSTADYVAISQDPNYVGGAATLLEGMPGGLISLRCDVAAQRAVHKETLAAAFQMARDSMAAEMQMPEQAAGLEMIQELVDWAEEAFQSIETLDLSLQEQEGEFELNVAAKTDGKGPFAQFAGQKSNLAELGEVLPGDMMMHGLLRFDMNSLMEFGAQMEEQFPPEKREQFAEYMERMNKLTAMLGGDWAMAADFGEKGMRVAMVGSAKDAEAYLSGYNELITATVLTDMGMAFVRGESRKIGDTEVASMRFKIDWEVYMKSLGQSATMPPEFNSMMEKFFGKDGLLVEMAARDGRVYYAIGSAEVMDAMLTGSSKPAWLAAETSAIQGELSFLLRIDFHRFKEAMDAFTSVGMELRGEARSDTKPIPGGPAPIVLTASIDGDTYRLRLSGNPGKIAALK